MSRPVIERPTFRPGMVPGRVDPDQVFLLTETRQYVLIGEAYHALAPLLDGSRPMGRVVEEAARVVELPQAMYALEQLIRKGYVVDAPAEPIPEGTAAWWDAHGVAPDRAAERLEEAGVGLVTLGAVPHDAVRGALAGAGLRVTGEDAAAPLDPARPTVVLVDDALHPGLEEVDERHRARGRPWLLAKPVGTVLWIGPVFVPGETACWHCLARRLGGNRQVEAHIVRHGGSVSTTSVARAPAVVEAASHLLATAVEQWCVRGEPPEELRGRVRTLDAASWAIEEHAVVRRPQCPACGDPALRDPEREPEPVVLESRAKVFTGEGGHRARHPRTTLRTLEHHVSPITGIVSSLVRKEPEENVRTFSYAAGHDFVHAGRDLDALRANLRFRSGGKGVTELQARVSAICEAVERWSGVWRGTEPRVAGTAREMGDRALSLERILGFSEAQYDARAEWNPGCSPTGYHLVPHRLDPELEIDWVWAHPLGSPGAAAGARRLIPAAWAYYGHPDARHFFCATDANGTAAGNTLEEAILQGFLELVERDAVAVWWYNRIRRPAVELEAFGDPWVEEMVGLHDELGRDLWVLDLTHDLGIPVFAGLSRRREGPTEDILASFGAHFDPALALTRAITEVNQFLPAVSPRNADGSTRYAYDDPDAVRWWSEATVEDHPYLAPDPGAAPHRPGHWGYRPREDLRDDVHACVRAAAGAGLETYVLDQSRPDVELRVVRVVVPGLRHFWRRLGPGRLYDVPVEVGWLDAPLSEDELNPVSMFF